MQKSKNSGKKTRNLSEYRPGGGGKAPVSQGRRIDRGIERKAGKDSELAFPGRKYVTHAKVHPGNLTLGKDGQGKRTPLRKLNGMPIYRGGKTERIPVILEPEKVVRFSELLFQVAKKEIPTQLTSNTHPEPFAHLDYNVELNLKNQALQDFWKANSLPDKPNRIIPSPKPRNYRITSRRRLIFEKGAFQYDLPIVTRGPLGTTQATSKLDLREHEEIYSFILSKLNQPAYAQISHAVNYIVIRGDYSQYSVIFNLQQLTGNVVRKAKLLSDHFQNLSVKIVSAFLFYDSGKFPFYLDQRSPEGQWKFKKLFGPDNLHLRVGEQNYAFHPITYCESNASILPAMLEKAHQLLKARPEQRLLDLYCGFGLYSLGLAGAYQEVIGIDASGMSIEAAQAMAGENKRKIQFRSARIQTKTLEKILPSPNANNPEALFLDPPKNGTEAGLIRALASRGPVRIVHLFSNMESLPKEVNQWRKNGYMIAKVVPLDTTPGTDHLAVMVLFIPDRYSILNRIEKKPAEGYNGPYFKTPHKKNKSKE